MQLVRPIGTFILHTAYITSSREIFHHKLSHNRIPFDRGRYFETYSQLPSSSSVSLESIEDSDLPNILSVKLQENNFSKRSKVDCKQDNIATSNMSNINASTINNMYNNNNSGDNYHDNQHILDQNIEYIDDFDQMNINSNKAGLGLMVDRSMENKEFVNNNSNSISNTNMISSTTNDNCSNSDFNNSSNSTIDEFKNAYSRYFNNEKDYDSYDNKITYRENFYRDDDLLSPLKYQEYKRLQSECSRLKAELKKKESNFDKANYKVKRKKVYEPIEVRVGLRIQEADLLNKCNFFKKKALKGYPLKFIIKTDGRPDDYELAADGIFNKAKTFLEEACTTTGKISKSTSQISMYFKPIKKPEEQENDNKRDRGKEFKDNKDIEGSNREIQTIQSTIYDNNTNNMSNTNKDNTMYNNNISNSNNSYKNNMNDGDNYHDNQHKESISYSQHQGYHTDSYNNINSNMNNNSNSISNTNMISTSTMDNNNRNSNTSMNNMNNYNNFYPNDNYLNQLNNTNNNSNKNTNYYYDNNYYHNNQNHGYKVGSNRNTNTLNSYNRGNYYIDNNYNRGYYDQVNMMRNNMLNQNEYLRNNNIRNNNSSSISNTNMISSYNRVNDIDNHHKIPDIDPSRLIEQNKNKDPNSRWIVKNKPSDQVNQVFRDNQGSVIAEPLNPSSGQGYNNMSNKDSTSGKSIQPSNNEPSPIGDGSSGKWKVLYKKSE